MKAVISKNGKEVRTYSKPSFASTHNFTNADVISYFKNQLVGGFFSEYLIKYDDSKIYDDNNNVICESEQTNFEYADYQINIEV